MNEGGQSSTGQVNSPLSPSNDDISDSLLHVQLIDFILTTHPAAGKAEELAKASGKGLFEFLEEKLEELKKERGAATSSESLELLVRWTR
jgi:hypothetical protein